MKRFSELTAEERREAAISQDHGDGRDAAYSAQRLGMALTVVEAILARQAEAWKAKHAERIEAAQITWPTKPPQNVCCSCVNLWIRGVNTGRAAGVAEPRGIACPHMPGTDGALYEVAYLAEGSPPVWLMFSGVPPAQYNALMASLRFDNGQEFVNRGRRTNQAIGRMASDALATARRRQLAPLALALGAVIL